MANKTITSSTDISSLIATGLEDGENIDINNGAILTYDVSPSVLIGQTKINDGKMLLDGANATNPIIFCGEYAEEINVNGAGVLETTLGWYIFTDTSDGTSGYTLNVAEYFSADSNNNITADIHTGIWVETGRRINYDNATGVPPVVGDWLFKVSDNSVMGRICEVGSGYVVVEDLTGSLADNDLIELHTLQDNNGPDYQKSWTASCVGSDTLESDVWTKWANTFQNNEDRMSLVGNGNDGRVFLNEHGTNNLIFGDGTAGRIPPSGCRFKLPMVHFCTSDTTNYANGDTTATAGTGSVHNIETALGGDIIFRGASCGTVFFADTQASSFIGEHVCCQIGFGSSICGSKTHFKDVIIIGSLFNTTSSPRKFPFELSDLINGSELEDCALYYLHPNSTETGYLSGQTSKNLSFTRCIQVTCTTNEEAFFNQVDGVTIYDMELYGGDIDFTTTTNIDARLLKMQAVVGTVARNTTAMITCQKSTSNVFIAGIEVLKGSVYNNHVFNISDSSLIKIRGFHFIDDKLDCGGVSNVLVRTGGLCTNVDVARVYRTNSSINESYTGTSVSSDITLSNVASDYDGEIEPRGTNIRYRGVHGGSGKLGDSTGLETDYTGSFGGNSICNMRSDTTGTLAFVFMPGSTKYPITDIVGNPKFTKDGDFDVVAGDSFTIVTDKYFGITGFTGVYTASRATGSIADGTDEWGSNLTIEMQYNDGSGYNGTWLDVKDTSDMTGIPDLRTGAIFKVRITATGARTNLNGLMIHFTTSIQAQKDNLYPIDQFEVDFAINGLIPGSIVELYDNEILDNGNNNTKLAGTTNSGNSFTYTHNGVTNDIRVLVIADGYVEIMQDFTLSNIDQSLTVIPILDTND